MPPFVSLDGGHDLAEAEDEALVAKMVPEPFDDLGVAELEHRRATLDDGDLRPERREHRGVLDPDDPGADDDDRRRDLSQPEQAVRVDHGQLVELDLARAGRVRADGDHDVRGGDPLLGPAVELEPQRVRVDEARRPRDERDVVALQLVADHVDLARDHALRALPEVGHRDVGLDPVARAVHLALDAGPSGR